MPVRLLVTANAASADGDKPPPQELKLDGETLSIGRDKSSTVVLAEPSVSRAHARITREGSLYFLEDVGSAYGTRVNGQLLPKGEKRLLRNGDVIAVGTFDLTFSRVLEVTAEGPGDGKERTTAMARAVMKDVMRGIAGGSSPFVLVLNGPHKDQRLEMPEAREITVGRAEDCELVLSDDLTSRKHAKIRRDWSGTHVEDLGSRNGVKVNRKPIRGPTTLKDRDELEIGATRLLYVDPNEIREAPFVPPQTDPGLVPSESRPARVPRRPRVQVDPSVETADGSVPSEPPAEPEKAAEPVPEPEPEPPPPEPDLPELPEEMPPPRGMGGLKARLPAMPTDAASLKRLIPLFIVGGIAVSALVVLVWIVVGV